MIMLETLYQIPCPPSDHKDKLGCVSGTQMNFASLRVTPGDGLHEGRRAAGEIRGIGREGGHARREIGSEASYAWRMSGFIFSAKRMMTYR